MKKAIAGETRVAILERPIACYEEVEAYPKNKVCITFTDGGQVFIEGPLERFYEMVLSHFTVSVRSCCQMAEEVLVYEEKKNYAADCHKPGPFVYGF